MKDEGHGMGSVLFSFLLGGLVGAGFALLLAPQSGRETRRKIGELTGDLKERAEGYVEHAKESVSSRVHKGKEYIDEKKSILSAAVDAGKEAYAKEKERHEKGA